VLTTSPVSRRPAWTGGAVLESRLGPPRLRDGTIARPELADRLRLSPAADVALVVAPAGYGKTTLLAERFRRPGKLPLAWLSVDERDNDPVMLLTYLVVALNRIGVCDGAVIELIARPRTSLSSVLTRLRRALAAAGPFGLLVDDLQVLTSEQSLAALQELVDHLPPRAQLVLSSRVRPPLELSGRLVELGIDDLRLSDEETAVLLRSTGLTVSAGDAAELAERTEGWPAGVYLAALATLAQHGTKPVTAFSGSDRFVSDYVRAEHLAYLPPEDVDFMVRASVLERMSGRICDAVLQRSHSSDKLEELARTNLFLIPLAGDPIVTYRFQRLFREALAAELRHREPGLAEMLADRASRWCETNGDLESAIEYAWAAGDLDRFASLLEQFALPLYESGRLLTIDHWLQRADEALLEQHGALAVVGATLYGTEGRDADAERWIGIAERTPADATMPDGSPAEAWLAQLRAARCTSGPAQMRTDAQRSLDTLAEESSRRAPALLCLGVAHLLAGENGPADEVLVQAHAAATRANATQTAAAALAERSRLAGAEGRWDDAETLAVEARDALRDAHLEDHVASALTYAASARAAVETGNWVRARRDLERAGSLLPALGRTFPWLTAHAEIEVGHVRLAVGDADGAAELVAAVTSLIADGPDLGVLAGEVAALARAVDERSRPRRESLEHLTPAELRLLPLLTTHLTFREIAEHLNVSRNTVKTQAICTYRKLGASSRSEAIQRAIELGLVERADVLEASRSL
jgi:LuxR family maltose regulon positive regulatory protein